MGGSTGCFGLCQGRSKTPVHLSWNSTTVEKSGMEAANPVQLVARAPARLHKCESCQRHDINSKINILETYDTLYCHYHEILCMHRNGAHSLQSTSLITTLGEASKRCPYSRSVIIPEVSLYVLQWDGTLLWAWKFCRYSRIVVRSAVVISEVDCIISNLDFTENFKVLGN